MRTRCSWSIWAVWWLCIVEAPSLLRELSSCNLDCRVSRSTGHRNVYTCCLTERIGEPWGGPQESCNNWWHLTTLVHPVQRSVSLQDSLTKVWIKTKDSDSKNWKTHCLRRSPADRSTLPLVEITSLGTLKYLSPPSLMMHTIRLLVQDDDWHHQIKCYYFFLFFCAGCVCFI